MYNTVLYMWCIEGFRNDLLRLGQVQEQVQGADEILSGQYLLSLPQAFQVVLIGKGGGEGTLSEI